jgi:hypothetical protein
VRHHDLTSSVSVFAVSLTPLSTKGLSIKQGLLSIEGKLLFRPNLARGIHCHALGMCMPSSLFENAKPRIAELLTSACVANFRPRNATRCYLSCRSTDYGVQASGS